MNPALLSNIGDIGRDIIRSGKRRTYANMIAMIIFSCLHGSGLRTTLLSPAFAPAPRALVARSN